MKRIIICVVLVGIAGCSGASDIPEGQGAVKVSWYPLQVSSSEKSVTIVASYSSCRSGQVSASKREFSNEIRLTLSVSVEPDGTDVCDSLRYQEVKVNLAQRLGGRPILGSGLVMGSFGDAFEDARIEADAAPNVIGMQAGQALRVLCRWGLHSPASTAVGGRKRVSTQSPARGEKLKFPTDLSARSRYTDSLGEPCNPGPRAGAPVRITTED